MTNATAVENQEQALALLFAGEVDADAPREPMTEEDFVRLDHRLCDCELTYVHRKRHAALGTGIQIRLCCLAKAVEKMLGVEEGTFFRAFEFRPSWVWDCHKEHEVSRRMPDGSVVSVVQKLGPPPRWLLDRMREKGIEVRNLPQ